MIADEFKVLIIECKEAEKLSFVVSHEMGAWQFVYTCLRKRCSGSWVDN